MTTPVRYSHPWQRGRQWARASLVVLLLGALAGCAVPRPAPPRTRPTPVPEIPAPEADTTPEPGQDIRRELAVLRADGDFDGAVALLRGQLTLPEPPFEPTELQLLIADNLEAGGRDGAAAVEYALLTGAERARERSEAWEGLARIRGRGGDAIGSARAHARAWQERGFPPAGERVVRRAVQSLPTAQLRHLEVDLRGAPQAHEMVVTELAERTDAIGRTDEIVVTLLVPVSGKFEQFGAAFALGAELALRERNAAGRDSAAFGDLGGMGFGMDGDPREVAPEPDRPRVPVRLVKRDSQGDIAPASREARAAIVEDGTSIILGPLLSAPALAAGSVAQALGVPLVAPTATDPAVRTIGRFVLPLDAAPGERVEPLAEFAVNALGGRRFGALVPQDGVSDVFERAFRDALASRGAELTVSLAFEPEQSDFRRLLDRFTEADVDAVYIPGSATSLESLAPQMDFYEFDRRVLGNGDWLSPRILDPGNLALEGALFAATEAEYSDSPFMLHLRRLVWNESHEEISRFHVRGWQAMEAVLMALDEGARDADALIEVLARREDWEGRPASESVHLMTYRDGVLGPAAWAVGFDLDPKKPSEPLVPSSESSGP